MRNTEGTNSLKADAFATADCKFQLANLAGTPAGYAASGSKVADDPSTTDCDENMLLLRKPDGTIQYRAKQHASTRPASTASPSTTAPPALTGCPAATTTTPSGVAKATTSSRATAATTWRSAARATT